VGRIIQPRDLGICCLLLQLQEQHSKKDGHLNAFCKIEKKTSKQTVPIYTHYKFSFAACDEFNKGLGDRTWPHKKGGRNCPGDRGCQHDFMLSCILQNVFNYYRELSRRSTENISFMDLCLTLADEIHTHCQTIV
jgi:hypothetical protein